MSLVMSHLSLMLTATAADPSPDNSPTMQRSLVCQDIIFVNGNQPIYLKTPNNFKTQVALTSRNPPPPKIIVMCHISHVICHVSHVKNHKSNTQCHLTTTLCSFRCYEIPRKFGDAAANDLVIFVTSALHKV